MATNSLLTSILVFFIALTSSSCLKQAPKTSQISAGNVAEINQVVAENTVQLPNQTPDNQSPKIPVHLTNHCPKSSDL